MCQHASKFCLQLSYLLTCPSFNIHPLMFLQSMPRGWWTPNVYICNTDSSLSCSTAICSTLVTDPSSGKIPIYIYQSILIFSPKPVLFSIFYRVEDWTILDSILFCKYYSQSITQSCRHFSSLPFPSTISHLVSTLLGWTVAITC